MSPRYSEENGVVVHLLHAVVLEMEKLGKKNPQIMSETNNIYLQQNTRVGIYVGPGVLDLAGLQEDWWDQHVQLGDKFEQFVVREMLESELPLTGVSGVSLAEDSVTVARDDLSRLEETPNKLLHLVVSGVQTHSSHHLLHEDEHLLVGETVERPGQPAHPGAEGEVGVRQSRAHQVSGVGRHVAALVVTEIIVEVYVYWRFVATQGKKKS